MIRQILWSILINFCYTILDGISITHQHYTLKIKQEADCWLILNLSKLLKQGPRWPLNFLKCSHIDMLHRHTSFLKPSLYLLQLHEFLYDLKPWMQKIMAIHFFHYRFTSLSLFI